MVEDFEILIKIIDEAGEFCEREFSHEELIETLEGEDDSKKQICLLKLKKLKNEQEAKLLVFHLTDHHGIVRESCAQKLHEFILNGKYIDLFSTKYVTDSFLRSVNDINPNICRTMIETLPFVLKDKSLKKHFLTKLYERFEAVFEELERLKRSNWYTKKLFNLYWCLETLAVVDAPLDDSFCSVLRRTCAFREYTIREKSALVLAKITPEKSESTEVTAELRRLKATMEADPNFYVRNVFQSSRT